MALPEVLRLSRRRFNITININAAAEAFPGGRVG